MDTVGPILGAVVMLGGFLSMVVADIRMDRELQDLQATYDALARIADHPAPESPAQRQLREWQARLDARHPPERPTPAELERLLTPFPPMPVPAPQYTPPDSPPGMARWSAR